MLDTTTKWNTSRQSGPVYFLTFSEKDGLILLAESDDGKMFQSTWVVDGKPAYHINNSQGWSFTHFTVNNKDVVIGDTIMEGGPSNISGYPQTVLEESHEVLLPMCFSYVNRYSGFWYALENY